MLRTILLVHDFDITRGGRIERQTKGGLETKITERTAGRSVQSRAEDLRALIRTSTNTRGEDRFTHKRVSHDNTGGVRERHRIVSGILRIRRVRRLDVVRKVGRRIIRPNRTIGGSREKENALNRVLTTSEDGDGRSGGNRRRNKLVRGEGGNKREEEQTDDVFQGFHNYCSKLWLDVN